MFKPVAAFSGFSVLDLAQTNEFYSQVLGLRVETDAMGLYLHLPSGARIFIYQKADHQPATFTVLNLVVENIDEALENLQKQGVTFEQYDSEEMPQDEKGILRGLKAKMGPDIAWFKDPSGNVLSILQDR